MPRTATLPLLMFGDRDRRLFDRYALPLYTVALLAVLPCVIAVASGSFGYDPMMLRELAQPIGFFLLIAWAVRWSGFPKLAALAEAMLLGMFITFLMTFVAAILATAAMPMADVRLAAIDRAMFGFERSGLTAFGVAHPVFRRAMFWIYTSFAWTPQLLLAGLFLTGRTRLGWTVASALMLTLAAIIYTSWLLPAYGAPPYPYRFVEVLDGVRAGRLRMLDQSLITGIVTFPSLHAADAVVLAWGYARLGRIGWPLAALNVLMIGSAVVVGGHYIVDVVAGGVIAAVAIVAAGRVDRWLSPDSAPRSAS